MVEQTDDLDQLEFELEDLPLPPQTVAEQQRQAKQKKEPVVQDVQPQTFSVITNELNPDELLVLGFQEIFLMKHLNNTEEITMPQLIEATGLEGAKIYSCFKKLAERKKMVSILGEKYEHTFLLTKFGKRFVDGKVPVLRTFDNFHKANGFRKSGSVKASRKKKEAEKQPVANSSSFNDGFKQGFKEGFKAGLEHKDDAE